MSGSQKQSVWGTFLQSAVTGMETRLDSMLDDDEQQKKSAPAQKPAPKPATTPRPTANDRLQARLAKAMAAKGQDKGTSPRPSMERSSTETRPSFDGRVETPKIETPASEVAQPEVEAAREAPTAKAETPVESGEQSSMAANERADIPAVTTAPLETPPATAAAGEGNIEPLSHSSKEPKPAHQEEIQEYVEQIDSLQSKLQYLAKNAAESAKGVAAAAEAGSVERKLAEKDERIALLLEEGAKLSTSEGRYRNTIKKLRQSVSDAEKRADEQSKARNKTVADLETLKKRFASDEDKKRRDEESGKVAAALRKEIDALKKEASSKDDQIKDVQKNATYEKEQLETAHAGVLKEALAAEHDRHKELEDQLAAARSENERLEDNARIERVDWKDKYDRATERSQKTETELRKELHNLESKLEAMRAAAEEATSSSGGEAQLKLLRQIETLQTQYATASSNWQGIEASLLAKVAAAEGERDEAQKRESDMRKKAREATTRLRGLEEELEDIQALLVQTQKELETCQGELTALRVSVKTTESALEQARSDLEKQQRAAGREQAVGLERKGWSDDAPRGQSRPDSPMLSLPRTFSSDLPGGLPLPGRSPRRAPTPGSTVGEGPPDGLALARRLSSQPPARPGMIPSSSSGNLASALENASDFPALERDDVTNTVPSSPRQVAQDMVSVSTAAAGPSVQLVERMSAAIRRLEGEKVTAKEEMARVCSQRDEARSDLIRLMKDVDEASQSKERVQALEKEVEELNGRYEATLELLGEKSELVEELRADVQDVKAMYRELVETTVK